MTTIPQAAVSNPTFCSSCEEELCDCMYIFDGRPFRITIIDGEPYKVEA